MLITSSQDDGSRLGREFEKYVNRHANIFIIEVILKYPDLSLRSGYIGISHENFKYRNYINAVVQSNR